MSSISQLLVNHNLYYINGVLDLKNKGLGDEDMHALHHFLRKHPEITKLDISDNSISNIGIRAFEINKTLTFLNLSKNRISDAGAERISNNKSLKTLDLSWNDITDIGAKKLSENRTLTSLNISWNEISNNCIKEFLKNTTLTSLKALNGMLETSSKLELEKHIELNRKSIKQEKKLTIKSRLLGQLYRALDKDKHENLKKLTTAHLAFSYTCNFNIFGETDGKRWKKCSEIMEEYKGKPDKNSTLIRKNQII